MYLSFSGIDELILMLKLKHCFHVGSVSTYSSAPAAFLPFLGGGVVVARATAPRTATDNRAFIGPVEGNFKGPFYQCHAKSTIFVSFI